MNSTSRATSKPYRRKRSYLPIAAVVGVATVCIIAIAGFWFLRAIFGTDEAAAHNNRGVTYENNNQHDLAIAEFDKAIQLKPDYALAYANRGWAHFNNCSNG